MNSVVGPLNVKISTKVIRPLKCYNVLPPMYKELLMAMTLNVKIKWTEVTARKTELLTSRFGPT